MKRLFLFLVVLTAILFNGCSIVTAIYVQNLTSTTVKFKVFYKLPIAAISYYRSKDYKVQYAERIVDPKMFKQEILKSSHIQKLSDSAVVIELPTLSTTRIEQTSNTNYRRYIDYIEYNGKKLELEDFIAIAKHKGHHAVYTIRPRRNDDD